MNALVWSNVFFVIPMVLALYSNLYLESIALLLVCLTSPLYHTVQREIDHTWLWQHYPVVRLLDWTCSAILLIVLSMRTIQSGNTVYMVCIFSLAAIALSVFAFAPRTSSYKWAHSSWHILSALIATIIVFYA
jgi:hypothetical protein